MSAQSSAPQTHPPLPSLFFRVGITGHRPDRLTRVDPDLLMQQIHAVLEVVAASARTSAASVHLVLITSLAEGVDRIAAHVGRELGYVLNVPLPMPAELYVSDFHSSASVKEFHDLLAAATRTFVLPPPEDDDRTSCYAAASNLVLNQCDLLLVVSDNGPSGGPGGAADTYRVAEDRGLLTVRIAALPSAQISFREYDAPLTDLASAVHRLLSPSHVLRHQLNLYRCERWPARYPVLAYAMLRLVSEWKFVRPPLPSREITLQQIQDAELWPYFQWADTLAMFYGERSRTASLRLQLLATLSIIAALLEIAFAKHIVVSRVLGTAEAVFLIWLLAGVRHSRSGAWHDRWLLYRSIAEQIRCVDILAPLGLSSLQPDPNIEEHCSATALMPWLVRRIEAERGLPEATVDTAYIEEHLSHVGEVLKDQARFHNTAAQRYQAAEQTFHILGVVFFWVAFVLAIYHLLHAWLRNLFEGFELNHPLADSLIAALAAILPALGAAAVAIVAQGEYKRLAERSASMRTSLDRVAARFARQNKRVSLDSVSDGCQEAAQVLSGEVRDWSDMLASRPPSIPV